MARKIRFDPITQEQIRVALDKFLQTGGVIKQLPPQRNPERMMGTIWALYENPLEGLKGFEMLS